MTLVNCMDRTFLHRLDSEDRLTLANFMDLYFCPAAGTFDTGQLNQPAALVQICDWDNGHADYNIQPAHTASSSSLRHEGTGEERCNCSLLPSTSVTMVTSCSQMVGYKLVTKL